jgi:DNA-3-methyladenine glycosylase
MRPDLAFYAGDCLEVAPALVGKLLCRKMPDGTVKRLRITETEAYRGEQDTACHAHKGRTSRTEVLYRGPGTLYVYLCYGIHWLLNIVTGAEEQPQAVLIRACEGAEGPGRLTKALSVEGSFNKQHILDNGILWVEDDGQVFSVGSDRRVGIAYASEEDQARLWRFILKR